MTSATDMPRATSPSSLYTPLQDNEIRLICLCPSSSAISPVHFSFVVTTIAKAPPFDALSYTWDNQPPSRPVYCDGVSTFVTKNVESAMRRLRGRAPWSKAYCIWIDAICINQSSISEKSRQVAMMGEIYSQARRVVVWLSYDDSSTAATACPTELQLRRAFARIRDIARETDHHHRHCCRAHPWNIYHLGSNIGQLGHSLSEPLRSRCVHHWKKVDNYLAARRRPGDKGACDKDKDDTNKVISQLVDHRYWTRIWTVQELALAKISVVYARGVGPLSGSDLRDAIVGKRYPFNLPGNWAVARLHLGLPHPPSSTVYADDKPNCDNLRHGDGLNRHSIVLGLVTKTAKEPQDLIFALRAVAPDVLGNIPVDYNTNLRELFVQATKQLLDNQTILDILFLASVSSWNWRLDSYDTPTRAYTSVWSMISEREDRRVDNDTAAPSWVPNWVGIPRNLRSGWGVDRGRYAQGRGSIEYRIQQDNTLSINACILGEVSEVISKPMHLGRGMVTEWLSQCEQWFPPPSARYDRIVQQLVALLSRREGGIHERHLDKNYLSQRWLGMADWLGLPRPARLCLSNPAGLPYQYFSRPETLHSRDDGARSLLLTTCGRVCLSESPRRGDLVVFFSDTSPTYLLRPVSAPFRTGAYKLVSLAIRLHDDHDVGSVNSYRSRRSGWRWVDIV